MLFRNATLLRVRDVVRLLVLERLEQIGVVDIHLRVLYHLSDELFGASGVIHEKAARFGAAAICEARLQMLVGIVRFVLCANASNPVAFS